MKKFLAALFLSLLAAAPAAAVDSTFFSGQPVSLYVLSTGDDFANDCKSAATPCQSLGGALALIPGGYISPVTIVMGAETYALPDMNVPPTPGSISNAGVHTSGSINILGACTAVKAFSAVSGSFVSGRTAQVTRNIGTYTGTVTDGSRFIQIGTAAPFTYKIVRASTTPNIVAVDQSSGAVTGTLCSFGTVFSGAPTFSAKLAADHTQHVSFSGVKFSGTAPAFSNVSLIGVSLASPGALANVDVENSFLGAAAAPIAFERGLSKINNSLMKGCTVITGPFDLLSGVVSATGCTSQGQLTIGQPGLGLVPNGNSFVRQIDNLDIEGNGTCMQLVGASARLGGGSTVAISCNPSASGAVMLMDASSRFGLFDVNATMTGRVWGPSPIKQGSILGPLQRADAGPNWAVVSANDAGPLKDFTVGDLDGGRTVLTIPVSDPSQLVRVYQ